MAQRRSELWQQKPNFKGNDAVENAEESDKGEKDILDDEEEEFTESEEEEDLLEDEFDDVEDVETEKQKSVFLDEEVIMIRIMKTIKRFLLSIHFQGHFLFLYCIIYIC